MAFLQSSAQASFDQYICVHIPRMEFRTHRHLLARMISFPEDRTVLALIVVLMIVRLCYDVSPEFVSKTRPSQLCTVNTFRY